MTEDSAIPETVAVSVDLTREEVVQILDARETPTPTPFASLSDIRLGMIVRDPATGLTGMATSKAEMISGSVQYAIQPQGDGKVVPESYYVDDFMLEYVGIGISEKVPAPDVNDTFRVGEKLRDKISGFAGIAVQRQTFLNGCIHYHLRPTVDTKKKSVVTNFLGDIPQGHAFDFKMLEQVDAGFAPKPTSEDPAPKLKRSETGGPMRRADNGRVPR